VQKKKKMIYILYFLCILFSFLVIFNKNPIHSIINLICTFICGAFILFILKTDFLAMSFLIIYIGAIAVLFLFVIMMLNIKILTQAENSIYIKISIGFFYIGFILFLIYCQLMDISNYIILKFKIDWFSIYNSLCNIEIIGFCLYTYYFINFIIAAFILFVAMIGAIVLSLDYKISKQTLKIFCENFVFIKKQNISKQVLRINCIK
jgi:NADH-quinone oxidoreductase subunit J